MRSIALAILLSFVIVVPGAVAQTSTPVNECTQQCRPKDADMNGPTIKRGDEPVKVSIYAHFEDILQRAAMNTQLPDGTRENDLNRGFPTPIIDSNTPVDAANFHFKHNQFILFGTPGLIEYGDTQWRIHQEPGLTFDLKFTEPEITLYWYMSAHAVPNQAGGSQSVSVMPQMGVYARMETGRFPFYGTVIAESADFDGNQVGSPSRVNMISIPGQPDVYEFVVKLKVNPSLNYLPEKAEANGWVLYVNPYQLKTDKTAGFQVAQGDWRLRTGPKFLPRLVFTAEKVMENRAASLNLFDNKMYVRWSFASALGSYDMRDAEVDLRVTGANPIDPKAIDHKILKKSIDHDGHFKPVNSTWEIDYWAHPLKDGEYELTASIPNLQQTYLLEQTFTFTVKHGLPQVQSIGKNSAPGGAVVGQGAEKADEESPSVEASMVVLVVFAALALVRLRRRG